MSLPFKKDHLAVMRKINCKNITILKPRKSAIKDRMAQSRNDNRTEVLEG